MILNFNLSGANPISFQVPFDSIVASFSTDRTVSGGNSLLAYLTSSPNFPAGFDDDSVTDLLILIADRDCSGEILREKTDLFIHPGINGSACLAQLRFSPISPENA